MPRIYAQAYDNKDYIKITNNISAFDKIGLVVQYGSLAPLLLPDGDLGIYYTNMADGNVEDAKMFMDSLTYKGNENMVEQIEKMVENKPKDQL